jgi:hypothetical protein
MEKISLMKFADVRMDLIGHLNDALAKYCKEKGYGPPLIENAPDGMMQVFAHRKLNSLTPTIVKDGK